MTIGTKLSGLALMASVLALSPAAYAQQPPADGGGEATATTRKARQLSVRNIVQKMTDESGITVLADSTVATMLAPTPEGATTHENLEDHLDKLVKKLPAGTKWAKIYLPAPEAGRRYSPDAVTQFVRAQAGLFGKAGESKTGMVEILGRKIPEAQAEPYVKGLGLVPVYVLSNLSAATARVFGGPGGAPGAAKGDNPVMDSLMKQLGVNSPRDIPTGDYKVPFTLPDGSMTVATVHVENDGTSMKIGVEVSSSGPQ